MVLSSLRIILLSPLALIRLIYVLLISIYVVTVGYFWIKLFGFSRRTQQWVMKTWGKSILFVWGIRVKHNEIPNNRNFILMPNHRSYLDIYLVAALSPAALVGKEELKNWPLFNQGVLVTNSILVARKELKSLIQTMQKIKNSVSNGIPVALFPEGTTFAGPYTKKFKKGSFKIAAETGIPIIPVAIEYEDKKDAWVGKDTFLAHIFRQMGKPISRVDVRFGKPIHDEDPIALQKATRGQIHEMLDEIYDERGIH